MNFGLNDFYSILSRIKLENKTNYDYFQMNQTQNTSKTWNDRIFKNKNITPEFKIVNYCGGGIAATLDAFVLYQLGFENLVIYDNSLSEWAMEPNLPMETG